MIYFRNSDKKNIPIKYSIRFKYNLGIQITNLKMHWLRTNVMAVKNYNKLPKNFKSKEN